MLDYHPINRAAAVLMDSELTFMLNEPDVPVHAQPLLQQMSSTLSNQFGVLDPQFRVRSDTLLLKAPIPHGECKVALPLLAAAKDQVNLGVRWDPQTNAVVITFQGADAAMLTMKAFWTTILNRDSLHALGRHMDADGSVGTIEFCPKRPTGVAPPLQFNVMLTVAAVRSIMDQLATTDGMTITLKWHGEVLWHGRIPGTTTAAMMIMLLRIAFTPVFDVLSPRLLCDGIIFSGTETIASISQDATGVRLHVVSEQRGGGGKTNVRAAQQTALASTLLEQGYDLKDVTHAVNTCMSTFGLHRIQEVTSMPMSKGRVQGVLKLCQEANVPMKNPIKLPGHQAIPGTPWDKASKKKRFDVSLDPSEFQLVDGYFTNEDDSAISQLDRLVPQSTGICLARYHDAQAWLRESQQISSDELAVLTIGHMKPATTLPTQQVTFPCRNRDNQLVLLNGFLTQFGAKSVKISQDPNEAIATAPCQLIAFTFFKDDWSNESWQEILQSPATVVRRIVGQSVPVAAIQSLWGKSLKADKSSATPANASSVQIHGNLEASHVTTMLKQSGHNKLYCTPKSQDGRLDTRYRIVWVSGDVPKLAGMCSKVPHALGLVRGRSTGLGLRVHQDHFADTWSLEDVVPRTRHASSQARRHDVQAGWFAVWGYQQNDVCMV